MKLPSWLKANDLRRTGDHAVVDVEVRERVFILAASKDQADLFARRWLSEKPDRRRQDAIYLHGGALDGHLITKADRLVGVEGYWRHPKADDIQNWLQRTLAKTGVELDIEPVAA